MTIFWEVVGALAGLGITVLPSFLLHRALKSVKKRLESAEESLASSVAEGKPVPAPKPVPTKPARCESLKYVRDGYRCDYEHNHEGPHYANTNIGEMWWANTKKGQ